MIKNLNGLVLAGGKSSRFGKDKSQLRFHGKPQVEHLTDLLQPFCDRVFISTPKTDKQALNHIPDLYDLDGPLNGILSAFKREPDTAWISVPVDMPGIDASSIKFLIDHRDTSKFATCFYDSDNQLPEPLFTLWEREARQSLLDFFYAGGRSPRQFLMTHPVQILQAPHLHILRNINTPEDYTTFLKQSGKNLQEEK